VGAERLIRPALLAALATLTAACQGNGGSDGDATSTTATPSGRQEVVEWIADGDTLTLRSGAKVRLVQVDAPELHSDCYGRAALQALIGLAPKGTRVTVVRDPRLDERDQHGRLLRYVFVGAENVNVELVRRGAASPYFFRNVRGRYADALLDAVEEARDARRGYWGACSGAELNTGIGSVTGPA
jgi:endonuclease YncB( thermonuclease family)